MKKEIRIPFNKVKLVLFLLGSILLVVVGIYFITYQPDLNNGVRTKHNTWGRFLGSFFVGFITVLFFGAIAITLLKKIFLDSYSVLIRKSDLIDNSVGISKKKILFSDITTTSIMKFGSNEFIFIYLSNPKEYINNQKNFFDKFLMKLNNRFYNTPIMINKHAVKYNFEELHSLLKNEIQNYKRNNE